MVFQLLRVQTDFLNSGRTIVKVILIFCFHYVILSRQILCKTRLKRLPVLGIFPVKIILIDPLFRFNNSEDGITVIILDWTNMYVY